MINNGKLPWSDLNYGDDFQENKKLRLEYNASKYIVELLPKEFDKIAKKILRMKFKDDPPYS